MMNHRTLACLAAAFTISLATCSSAEKHKIAVDPSKLPPASDKKDVTYASDIKAIFDKSCVKCHGTEKPKGKLRLDSLAGVLKGGEDGKAVQPGKSAESMLVLNIAHLGDPEQYMPPPKNKANIGPLTGQQIGLVRAWIDQGAK
jgi:mono/diheme cytochrome c family protein